MSIATESSVLHLCFAFPFLLLIRIYRLFSPLKQLILGPYARCRFYPTCSEYALECFQTLPLHIALFRSFTRIFRCNPMHTGGYDPVHPPCKHPSPDPE
jgi:putative membrane protein insertion efficiency factor